VGGGLDRLNNQTLGVKTTISGVTMQNSFDIGWLIGATLKEDLPGSPHILPNGNGISHYARAGFMMPASPIVRAGPHSHLSFPVS
jgi:hypothetical protein